MYQLELRKATVDDSPLIWNILKQAIERRRMDGSNQWQDGYPNPDTIQKDIENGWGYVFAAGGKVAAYAALIYNYEPAYNDIDGKWLSSENFLVVHRVAAANEFIGKGIIKQLLFEIEQLAMSRSIYSIKMDTNFDNLPMLHILNKLAYTYCGEVYFRGSARKAFEKVLR